MQVEAHLWYKGPVGGQHWGLNPRAINTFISQGTGSTTEPSPTSRLRLICFAAGVVYNDEELEALGEVMRKYSLIVISDEIYGHLTFKGNFTSISNSYF